MYTLGHDFVPPSIHAGGLRYHGDSPIISTLVQCGRMEAIAYPQGKTFEAAVQFAQAEGKIPAPETGHAVRAVIDAPADGYTLLLGSNNEMAIVKSINAAITYDPAKDFTPISLIGSYGLLMVVNPAVPARTVGELIAGWLDAGGLDGAVPLSGPRALDSPLTAASFRRYAPR